MKAFVLVCMLVVVGASAHAQSGATVSLASLSTQPSMNVFRRFAVEPAKMAGFYAEVLGLKQLPIAQDAWRRADDAVRDRFGAGQAAVHCGGRRVQDRAPCARSPGCASSRSSIPTRPRSPPASCSTAIRRRRFVPGAAIGVWRWCSTRRISGSSSSSLPALRREVYESIEVGLTVSDLEKSRAFYREFVGLDELPPVEDPLLGTTRYPYRHGTTTVTVWSFGKGLACQHAQRREFSTSCRMSKRLMRRPRRRA